MSSGNQSYPDICRICMEEIANKGRVYVFARFEESSVAEFITECTSVKMLKNDGLPDNICKICMTDLKSVAKFIRKVQSSDSTLKGQIKGKVKTEPNTSGTDNVLSEPQFDKVIEECEVLNDLQTDVKLPTVPSEHVESEEDINDPNDSDHSNLNDCSKLKTIKTSDESLNELMLQIFKIIDIDRGKCLCCSCLQQFDHQQALKTHSKEAHTNEQGSSARKKFACPYCQRRYSSSVTMKAHKRKMQTIGRVYECLECQQRLHDPQKLAQHAKSHEKKASSKMDKHQQSFEELMERYGRLCCALGCSESFETDAQLLAHAHSLHKTNRVEASLAYNEGKPTECSICFKRFKDEESLKRHLLFKYKPSKNICTLCGAKFPSLSSLTIHERSHTKEKPFQCEICCKAFGDKQSLKRHHVKHTQEKPFMCSVCGVSFKRKRAMQSHMIIHEPGQLPFKCDLCEKRFRIKAKMLYHKRTHTGEKPYPCRHCDKSFADFSNRMRHELSHTGEKPYTCSYCPKGFITRRFMLVHEKGHKRKEVKQTDAYR